MSVARVTDLMQALKDSLARSEAVDSYHETNGDRQPKEDAVPRHTTEGPIWPTMATDDPPSNEEIVAHNLACIVDSLDTLTGTIEELSKNLSAHIQQSPDVGI